MLISYLADRPELSSQLIPGLLEHWRYVFPDHTAEDRAAKFRVHQNYEILPIAWIAHDGDKALGTASLRTHDLEGREDLSPWLGGVFVLLQYRRRGIATALCSIVETKAASMGIKRLYLFTHGEEALYERMGWKRKEPTVWHGHLCTIMSKVPVLTNTTLKGAHQKAAASQRNRSAS